MTFDDLSRPQMTSARIGFGVIQKFSISGFQKYMVCKNSKKDIFKLIFEKVREKYGK